MKEFVRIPEYCAGPPDTGNGGFVAGAFAEILNTDLPVEVTLRSPVPLEKDLSVKSAEDLAIMDGDTLVAEVRQAPLELEVPEPPAWEEALAARPNSFSMGDRENPLFPGRQGFHPICFCCGVENEKGLKVFAAPVLDNEQVAAIWQTETQWANEDGSGMLPASYLWTALDCPGQFAYFAKGIRTGMLGRITAKILSPGKAGDEFMVTGWGISIEGKKHFAGTAVFTKERKLIAMAKSIWIGRQD